MMWYQVIEICNLEPLKIGSGGSKAHWDEPCKDYIPGSTLRGGAIARMRKQGLFDNDPKAILQHMECFNAYLYRDNQLFFPAPQHLRMDKHEYRRQKSLSAQGAPSVEVPLSNLFRSIDYQHLAEDMDKPLPKNALPDPFVTIQGEIMEGARPIKSYRLHHSSLLNADMKERANLFSYQALEPGQQFRSIIAFHESIRQPIESMWSGTDIWYLGGSKGSGYGRCRVRTLGASYMDYAEARQQLGVPAPVYEANVKTPEITLTCLSDTIIRGQYGEPLSYFPEEWIEEYGGIKLKRKSEGHSHFVLTGMTEGYNATWRARYPKETTIKAGSVMRYELEGEYDENLLQRTAVLLEKRRYGIRTQDGYGWIAVNLPSPAKLKIHTGPGSSNLQEEEQLLTATDCDCAEKEHIAKSIRLISKGLSSTRERWLIKLVQKQQEPGKPAETLIIRNLKSGHCRNMMNELAKWLQASTAERQFQSEGKPSALARPYCQDREYCSLAGAHFNSVLRYLWGSGEQPEHKALREFAARMLQSRHGQIYYGDSGDNAYNDSTIKQKRFIAELLHQGLYKHQMSVGGGNGGV